MPKFSGQKLSNQMLHLFELFPGILPVALLTVLGGRHSFGGVKSFGKYQRIAVSAGKRYALYGIGGGNQKFPCLGDAESGKKLLWRHAQVILK